MYTNVVHLESGVSLLMSVMGVDLFFNKAIIKTSYIFKFCLVHPNISMKEEMKNRLISRGNNEKTVKENDDMFEKFYELNKNESRATVLYELEKGEYLEDVLKKFGCKLIK